MLATARALASDGVCAEVVHAWQAVGIDSVLLKGATIAEWLYRDDARGYADVDLLVAPGRVMDAAAVLEQQGFVPVGHHVSLHAHPWVRPADGGHVDLHVTLWGAHRPAARVWDELQRGLEYHRIGPTTVRVLTSPARALLVVLHAAQHQHIAQPREDLRRVLRIVSDEVWERAAVVADRIGALKAMADGLRLEPEGARLFDRLPLVRAAAIAEDEDAPFAIGVARLSCAAGPRAKLGVLREGLIPSRTELQLKQGAIAHGGGGLAAAYARHVLVVCAGAPRSIAALWRASRSSIS